MPGCRDRFAADAARVTVTGLVLAAGSSSRLGQPKQLLPFRGRTLLDASLDLARALPVRPGAGHPRAAADEVRARST